MNYQKIKALAKEWGVSITTLIAQAPNNDPFYAGTPGHIKMPSGSPIYGDGPASPRPYTCAGSTIGL